MVFPVKGAVLGDARGRAGERGRSQVSISNMQKQLNVYTIDINMRSYIFVCVCLFVDYLPRQRCLSDRLVSDHKEMIKCRVSQTI